MSPPEFHNRRNLRRRQFFAIKWAVFLAITIYITSMNQDWISGCHGSKAFSKNELKNRIRDNFLTERFFLDVDMPVLGKEMSLSNIEVKLKLDSYASIHWRSILSAKWKNKNFAREAEYTPCGVEYSDAIAYFD